MDYDVPVLIDINKWFSITNELNGKESDLLFREVISEFYGLKSDNVLPNNVSIAVSNSKGLLNKCDEQVGVSHWNWRGGVTTENKKERASLVYKKWRTSVFSRDKFTCKKCDKKGGKLNAHHVVPFSINKELRYVLSNGITLCETCHINLHKTERLWL